MRDKSVPRSLTNTKYYIKAHDIYLLWRQQIINWMDGWMGEWIDRWIYRMDSCKLVKLRDTRTKCENYTSDITLIMGVQQENLIFFYRK